MTQKEKDQKLQLIFEKGIEFLDKANKPVPAYPAYTVPHIQKEVIIKSAYVVLAYSRILELALAIFVDKKNSLLAIQLPRTDISLPLSDPAAKVFMERLADDLNGERVEVIDADQL